MTHTHSTHELVGEIGKIVQFWGTPRQVDAGVGPYEYWGSKGYDSQPYITCEWDGIDWDTTLYTTQENQAIDRYYSDNESKIEQAIINNALKETEAYADQ